jgi:methylglutaconyl-CoA hydratase
MMSEQNSPLLYRVENQIGRITLNRPDKRNALNPELIAALKQTLRRANSEENVRAVMLGGAGTDFCAGADLSGLQKISQASVAENLDDARSLMELFILIRRVRIPVVAAVHGRAFAGGCGLALACDLVVASRSASFGFPEVKIGFVPAMVMALVQHNVSEKRAFELIVAGDEISAVQAESYGLINRVFDDGTFQADCESFVERFQRLSRSATSLSKRLLYAIDGLPIDESMSMGVDVNAIARMTEDCRKGIERFLKKS